MFYWLDSFTQFRAGAARSAGRRAVPRMEFWDVEVVCTERTNVQ
jgi:hypothetical protein